MLQLKLRSQSLAESQADSVCGGWWDPMPEVRATGSGHDQSGVRWQLYSDYWVMRVVYFPHAWFNGNGCVPSEADGLFAQER